VAAKKPTIGVSKGLKITMLVIVEHHLFKAIWGIKKRVECPTDAFISFCDPMRAVV
jgi:hypothetical protein